MSNAVNIVMQARSQQGVAAINAMTASIGRLENALARTARAGRTAGAKQAGAWGGLAGNIQSTIGMMLGVGTPLMAIYTGTALIRQEFERMLQLGRDAKEFQENRGIAIERAVSALRSRSTTSPEDLVKTIKDIAKDTGASQIVVAQAAEGILAAGGAGTAEQALEATRASLKLDPGTATAGDVSAITNLSVATKATKDLFPKLTQQQVAAFVKESFTAAFVRNPEKFAKNILPQTVLAFETSTHGLDLTEKERRREFEGMLAEVQAITQVSKDPEGRTSSTAFNKFVVDLMRFTTQKGFTGRHTEQLAFFQSLPRLEQQEFLGPFLSQDLSDEERKEFLDLFGKKSKIGERRLPKEQFGGRAKTKPVMALLAAGGDSVVTDNIEAAKRFTGHMEDAEKVVLAQNRELRRLKETMSPQIKQAATVGKEQTLGNEPRARRAEMLEILDTQLAAAGLTWAERRGLKLQVSLAPLRSEEQEIATTIEMLEEVRRSKLEKQHPFKSRTVSEDEQRIADNLQVQIDELQKVLRAQFRKEVDLSIRSMIPRALRVTPLKDIESDMDLSALPEFQEFVAGQPKHKAPTPEPQKRLTDVLKELSDRLQTLQPQAEPISEKPVKVAIVGDERPAAAVPKDIPAAGLQ